MQYFSVEFNPSDDAYEPAYIVDRTQTLEDAVLEIYSDIHTVRRKHYTTPSAYRISCHESESDEVCVWEASAEEVMGEYNLEAPAIYAGMYCETPRWLRGKHKNKMPTCYIAYVRTRWPGDKIVMLKELTSRGPSQDIRRWHYIRLEDIGSLHVFRRWEHGDNLQWMLKGVQ